MGIPVIIGYKFYYYITRWFKFSYTVFFLKEFCSTVP